MSFSTRAALITDQPSISRVFRSTSGRRRSSEDLARRDRRAVFEGVDDGKLENLKRKNMQTFNARLCVVALALGAAVSAVGSDALAPAFGSLTALKAAVDACLSSNGKDASGSDCFLKGDGTTECSSAGSDCYFISDWDVSGVTVMFQLFYGKKSFNQDIGNWNVASVTDMTGMFTHAHAFNQDIGNWNVASVTDMSYMFNYAYSFNQDIGNWNVASVTDMESMFNDAYSFNQDIGNWNVASVTDMSYMFDDAYSFNQDIGNWDFASVTDMDGMFNDAYSFGQDLSGWNTPALQSSVSMFTESGTFCFKPNNVADTSGPPSARTECAPFESPFTEKSKLKGQINYCLSLDATGASCADKNGVSIRDWDVSGVTNMAWMFINAQAFNQDIGNWDVGSVTDMGIMFHNARAFNQDISRWDVSSVEKMGEMFKHAVSFDANILDWKTTAITEQFDDDPDHDDGRRKAIENMFLGATAWLAKYRRIPVMSNSDYDDYDFDYHHDDRHDFDTFGPPSAWILRPEHVVNGTNGSDGSNGSGGLSGSSGSDFPEWGIALAGVALAISTVTSIFFLIQKLCCSGPKYHPSLTYAMQDQPQPQRVVVVANQV